ncbi:MAG: HAD-IA family hydrolase [Brachymonas sp.]|nr:HAD-IA family hydrolase [Brachymonas sp.]
MSHPTPAFRTRRYPLVVFDWDGTLFDSAGSIVRSIQAAVVEVGGKPPSADAARHVIGLSLQQALEQVAPDVPSHRLPLLAQAYREQYRKHQNDITLFEGVHNLLLTLKGRGHLLAVATGKSRAGLDEALEAVGLRHVFDATRTADQTASKPDPLMLHELMDELNTAPVQTLMIGDTSHDLRMAHNAACPAVAVSYGAHDATGLAALRPLHTAHSVADLQQWLLAHG